MEIVDAIGAVGEVIGWVGLIAGIPLLLLGLLARVISGSHTRTRITILEDLDDRPVALWSSGDRTHTRPLTAAEAGHVTELSEPYGYVSDREPERMRLDARSLVERACMTISFVLLGAAVVGFLASFLPVFWA